MRRSTACQFIAAVIAVMLAGCGFKMAGSASSTGAGGQTGGAGGGGGMGGAGGAGGRGGGVVIILDGGNDGPRPPDPDANCGARSKTAMQVAPDILIVLDRSGSMDNDVMDRGCVDGGFMAMGMCGARSKWALITPAINQVVSETDMNVNWGLKFFPDSTASVCNVGANVAVPIGPGNGTAVTTAIMGSTNPSGGVMTGYNATPTRNALTTATTYLASLTDNSKKYILLATDGLPNCPAMGTGGMSGTMGDDSAGATMAVGDAKTAGFPTFVVGIATTGMGMADMTLSRMADAGGLARTGVMPSYYPVSNATDLAAAIRTLIGVTATCTFQIGPAPTTDGTTRLDRINVFGDGSPIMRDTTHTNGYDYTDSSMESIQVYGPLCDQIMSGAIHDVTVTFVCIPG
jgi:hypothetical protein